MASQRLSRLCCICTLWIYFLQGSHAQIHWNEYWNRWKQTNGYPRLYPYGPSFEDNTMTIQDAITGINPQINFKIPYYGTTYSSVTISSYGFIGFPYYSALYLDRTWPNQDFPNTPDPAFAAPFYSENAINPRGGILQGRIYWRKLDEREFTDVKKKEIAAGMLNEISYQVRAAVVGADAFIARYGVVVTWHEMTFTGPPCPNNKCPLNTYQAVLVTDEENTYAIYNYWNITWVGGSNQNCDPVTGKPSAGYPQCKLAVAGFNSGHGRYFTHLPYSGTNDIIMLDERSGTNITGQFIYSVGADKIVRGGCYNGTTKLENWNLEISPNFGGQLGGNLINISGPCFTPKPGFNLKCRFDDQDGVGYNYPTNDMKGFCVSPKLNVRGQITLQVSLDGGSNYQSVPYHVVPLNEDTPKVILNEAWFESDAQSLQLTWNPNDLDNRKNLLVDVNLFGYMEIGKSAEWKRLAVIKSRVKLGDGKLTFNPKEHRANDSNSAMYQVGAVQVSVNTDNGGAGENPNNPRAIWSEVIPLGWFVVDKMKSKHGGNWPAAKCNEWKNGDGPMTKWDQILWPCPCKYEQAYTNFGHWLPDTECDFNSKNKVCRFHPGARHCVRSAFPWTQEGSDTQGSGNQCCYDQSGHLMYSEDSMSGSTPDKSQPWGLVDFKTAPKVPSMSHWLRDVIPQFYCCRWSQSCMTYLERRKTVDCKAYKSPRHAIAFGDPHFQTFDGKKYTFNGKGEFVLMKIDGLTNQNRKVELQGRFEQPANQSWGAVRGTLLTSVVLRQDDAQAVQIQLHTDSSSSRNKLSVFVNKEMQLFNTPNKRRDFSAGKVIVVDTSVSGAHQSNFTVILNSGVAMRVSSVGDHIHATVEVPDEAKGKTSGLFGTFDGNSANDLTPKNSALPVTSNDMRVIHEKFGISWNVKQPESLFKYFAKMNWEHFNDLNFVPNYETRPQPPNNSSVTDTIVNKLCGDNNFCQYDYRVTADSNIASATLHEDKWFVQMQDVMSRPVNACGILPVQNAIRNSTNGYLIGSVVTIKGCNCDCTLEGGKTRFECVKQSDGSGIWVPSTSGVTCTSNSELGNRSRMAAAIAVPIILVIVLAIVIVATVIIFRKRKEQKTREQQKAGNDAETPKGGNTETKQPYTYPRPTNMNPDPTKEKDPIKKSPNDTPVRAAPPDNPNSYSQYENAAITPEDIALEAVAAREMALEAAARRELAYSEAAKREMELEAAARKEAELAVAARLAEEHINRSRRSSKDSTV